MRHSIRASVSVPPFRFAMAGRSRASRPPAAFAALLLLLLFSGCAQQAAQQPGAPEEPPDYSYDIAVKGISTWPRTVYLGDDYVVRVVVEIYGRHMPSSYRLRVFDYEEAIYDSVIAKPGLIRTFEFNYTNATEERHNIRAYVESYDPLHPEPRPALSNNFAQKVITPQPLGYYGQCFSCMHLYYDAVNYVMRQAQAINLTRNFTVHRVGLYLRAPPNTTTSGPVIVEICRDNSGRPGEPVAASAITDEIGPEPGWHYAQFQDVPLQDGKYWIVARMESSASYGVQWARAEGNPYGEPYDTMVFDLADWPEWDYKLFDFVFQVY